MTWPWLIGSRAPEVVREPAALGSALADPRRLDAAFSALDQRLRTGYRRHIAANHPELTLDWILNHRRAVRGWIMPRIRACTYRVSPARMTRCLIGGKERALFRFEWPDMLVQMVLATALAECAEARLHPSLFSYRKGRSVQQAVATALAGIAPHKGVPVYVLRRDVKSYGDSVPHDVLFTLLDEWLAPADAFIRGLIRQFVSFDFLDPAGVLCRRTQGLPTGTALNCVLENIYLSPMDTAAACVPGVTYVRYGDDLWASSTDKDAIADAGKRMDLVCAELGLCWHRTKSEDVVLRMPGTRVDVSPPLPEPFQPARRVDHLGVSLLASGAVGVPAARVRLWRSQLRAVLRCVDRRTRAMGFSRQARLASLVRCANQFIAGGDPRVAHITHLLTMVTDARFFIELDQWVAELILAVLYGSFRRSHFRKTRYAVLKGLGLVSLHLLRQAMLRKKQVVPWSSC